MYGVFWWIRQVILVLVGCFFLFFGINILIAAYPEASPHFSPGIVAKRHLMILISATLVLGFILRMVRVYKQLKNCEKNETDL